MPIPVVCPKCSKHYRVEERLRGKPVRCKACGADMVVPAFEPIEAPPVTAEVEPEPAPAAHAAAYAAPAAEVGFNAHSLSRAEAPRAAAPVRVARRSLRSGAARDSLGVRINRPYENAFLAGFDAAGTAIAQILYWLGLLLMSIQAVKLMTDLGKMAAHGDKIPWQAWAVVILYVPAYFVLSYYVMIPLMAAGVALASKLMKFEMPDEVRWRSLAAFEIAMIFGIGIAFIAALAGAFGHSVLGGGAVVTLAFVGLYLLAIILIIPVHFYLLKFFFRLELVEAIMAYVFQFIVMLGLNAVFMLALLLYEMFRPM